MRHRSNGFESYKKFHDDEKNLISSHFKYDVFIAMVKLWLTREHHEPVSINALPHR